MAFTPPAWFRVTWSGAALCWATRFASPYLLPYVQSQIPWPSVVYEADTLPRLLVPPNPDTVADALPFLFTLWIGDTVNAAWSLLIDPGIVLIEDDSDAQLAVQRWRDGEVMGTAILY